MEVGAFDIRNKKPLLLVGTAPYLQQLRRSMTPSEKYAMQHNSQGKLQTAITWTDETTGIKKCTGVPTNLKATQAYPIAFGAAHAVAFNASCHASTVNAERPADLDPNDTDSEGSSFDADVADCFEDLKDNNPNYFNV